LGGLWSSLTYCNLVIRLEEVRPVGAYVGLGVGRPKEATPGPAMKSISFICFGDSVSKAVRATHTCRLK
jgi:hypothetical protein